jgi:hypothetical protein
MFYGQHTEVDAADANALHITFGYIESPLGQAFVAHVVPTGKYIVWSVPSG